MRVLNKSKLDKFRSRYLLAIRNAIRIRDNEEACPEAATAKAEAVLAVAMTLHLARRGTAMLQMSELQSLIERVIEAASVAADEWIDDWQRRN